MDFVGEIIEHEIEEPTAPLEPTTQGSDLLNTGFPDPLNHKKRYNSRWTMKRRAKPATSKVDDVRIKTVSKGNTTATTTTVTTTTTTTATTGGSSLLSDNRDEQTEPVSEAEQINQENIAKLNSMTDAEIMAERESILKQLNPKLVQSLIQRSQKRDKGPTSEGHKEGSDHTHRHQHAEGYNGWIGGMKTERGIQDLSQLDKADVDKALGFDLNLNLDGETKRAGTRARKTVTFDDNNLATVDGEQTVENFTHKGGYLGPQGESELSSEPQSEQEVLDKVAPKDYQIIDSDDEEMNNDTVHFTKPNNSDPDLDINDPDFFDKLHEKYYPDLPKETEKLSWMTKPMPVQVSTTYESISDMRFDFKGNLVQINIDKEDVTDSLNGGSREGKGEIPTYLGLHHHSENPHMAGYTLSELAHLSRSTQPGQRCISIQTLGRLLHKLGKHEFNILPINESQGDFGNESESDANLKEMMHHFESMMWDLVDELRIVESLTEAADEKRTRNLSVRNYAIEALWLLKTGGGRPAREEIKDAMAIAV
ncbi:hypothetical protein PVL30_004605 [Lodderomyces elongisporus]|uniref:uncharacterized protein n=1 Tax=Lodderomyces elongisporus TaxID=36914 RepID=UPI00291DB479|nr:uncharacterized protein PVL30_004605 [Lodderomyces elongisporus]WLF80815.1 hypothetical protein PVL30_004605 [Lodderomyces elongisporus]